MIVYAINANNCQNSCYTDRLDEVTMIIAALLTKSQVPAGIQINKREISKEEFDKLEDFEGFILNG